MKRRLRMIERQIYGLNQDCLQRFDRIESILCRLCCNDDLTAENQKKIISENILNHPEIMQKNQDYSSDFQNYSDEYIKSNHVKTPLEYFSKKIQKDAK